MNRSWIAPALAAFSLGVAYGLYTLFALPSFLRAAVRPETKGKQLEDMT